MHYWHNFMHFNYSPIYIKNRNRKTSLIKFAIYVRCDNLLGDCIFNLLILNTEIGSFGEKEVVALWGGIELPTFHQTF